MAVASQPSVRSQIGTGHVSTTIYAPVRPPAPRRPRMRRRLRLRHVVAASLVVCAGAVTLDALTPAAAHELVLRYDRDGVQMLCTHAQRGQLARVVGDGPAFTARCEADGPISTWNTTVTPHPAASSRPKLHILSKLLMVHRLVRVHRVFMVHRHYWLRRWFR